MRYFLVRSAAYAAAAIVATLMIAAPPAYAAEATVAIPLGDWLSAAAGLLSQIALPLVTIIVGLAMRALPSAVADYLKMLRVEQLLTRAVGYGLTAVKGAAEGKQLTVDVGNDVLAQALNYAVKHAPDVVTWAGGADNIREKILARLNLAPEASVSASGSGSAATLAAH